jgi:RNA polymerase sigma-70 factor (ECF subfamily)
MIVVKTAIGRIVARDIEASDETALVRAASRGNREAFASLYQLYAPVVHGILLAHVPREDVSDLILAALEKLHTLRDSASFGSWLAAIARNRARDFHRRSRSQEELIEGLAKETRTLS